MQDQAHGVVLTHEIFNRPLKVNVALTDQPTPEDYRHWPGGDELGKTMKMWRVQNKIRVWSRTRMALPILRTRR
jgi:hypothetical protein